MPAPVAIITLRANRLADLQPRHGGRHLVSLIAIGAIGAWSQAMVTLALVLTALLFWHGYRLAAGDLASAQPAGAKIIRPLLDAMQTYRRRSSIWCRS